jgi:glycosyltransferase involved in cell wall biosynthesis
MKIGLVILNRNEEEGLSSLLPRLPFDAVDLVFAVDGGSSDRSPELLRKAGVRVVDQVSPGRGEAFKIAFEEARASADALIFFSPDGNEDPQDLPRFRPFLEHGADMVIASRMMEGAVNEEDRGWWRPRKWANLAFSSLAYRTWGHGGPKISDPINGYRAITMDAWGKMNPDGPGYTIEYQTSIRAYKGDLRVAEFPTAEGQRIGGESKAKAVPTGLRFLRLYGDERRSD